MVNNVTLIGNLGDEVTLKKFDNGDCIGRFPLATSRSWKDKEGQKQTETSWHNITVRNKVAENCSKYLKKGSKCYVQGSILYRKWLGEDGKDKYTTEISARTVQFLDPISNDSAQPRTERSGREDHAGDQFLKGSSGGPPNDSEEDDDLPF